MIMLFIVTLHQDKRKFFVSSTLSWPNSFWLLQKLDMNQSIHYINLISKKTLLSAHITFDGYWESKAIMEKI